MKIIKKITDKIKDIVDALIREAESRENADVMICPDCNSEAVSYVQDSQTFFHCTSCGIVFTEVESASRQASGSRETFTKSGSRDFFKKS